MILFENENQLYAATASQSSKNVKCRNENTKLRPRNYMVSECDVVVGRR